MMRGLSITLVLLTAGCGTSFLPAREYDGATAVYRANTAVVLVSEPDDVWIDVDEGVTVLCGGPEAADPAQPPVGRVCANSSVIELSLPTGKGAEFVLCLDDCDGAEDILRGRIEPVVLTADDKSRICMPTAVPEPGNGEPEKDPPPAPSSLSLVHAGYVLAHGHVIDGGSAPVALVTTRKLETSETLVVEPIVRGVKVTCVGEAAPSSEARPACKGEGVLLAPEPPARAHEVPSVLVCAKPSSGEKTCATVLFREKKIAGDK